MHETCVATAAGALKGTDADRTAFVTGWAEVGSSSGNERMIHLPLVRSGSVILHRQEKCSTIGRALIKQLGLETVLSIVECKV